MVLQKSVQLSNWMKSGEKKKASPKVMSSGRRNGFSVKPVEQSAADMLKSRWVRLWGIH